MFMKTGQKLIFFLLGMLIVVIGFLVLAQGVSHNSVPIVMIIAGLISGVLMIDLLLLSFYPRYWINKRVRFAQEQFNSPDDLICEGIVLEKNREGSYKVKLLTINGEPISGKDTTKNLHFNEMVIC